MLGRPCIVYIGHLEPVDLSMYCVTGVEMVKIEFYNYAICCVGGTK